MKYPEVLDAIEDETPGPSGWYRVPCPFCLVAGRGNPKKRKLSVNAESGYFQCWRPSCLQSGFIELEDRHLRKFTAADRAKVEVDDGRRPLPEEFVPLGYDRPHGVIITKFWDYLINERGLRRETIVEAGIGCCMLGRYANMVVVPVHSKGAVVGFVTRSVLGKVFDTPPGFRKQEYFLNGDALYEESDEPMAIVEGQFDCLRHWPHAAASMGKPSHRHVALLHTVKRPLVIMLDPDMSAGGWELALTLEVSGRDVKYAKLPSGKDPGKLTYHEFRDVLLHAKRASATTPLVPSILR
jgi:hypothetical protein